MEDDQSGKCPMHMLTRRGFFKAVGGLGLFAAGAGTGAAFRSPVNSAALASGASPIPFFGTHQAGIATPSQASTYFAAFDLNTANKAEVAALLKAWTDSAAAMTAGKFDFPGMLAANLTLTFGFGPTLFTKDGKDRYGLAGQRPAPLVDMPKFNGDQMIEGKTGGDISVQACADDPQVAFQAIRQLVALAGGKASVRWAQTGFVTGAPRETPRNLQGFKDGTANPKPDEHNKFVWAGSEAPVWMQGGTYLAARRIRMALEHWDTTDVDFQEQVIGRHKITGAPLGQKNEFDTPDLTARDKDGNLAIPDNSHLRLALADQAGAQKILRRGYNYNDGASFISERWPPWRQGVEYDAGLLFICYQRDLRTGFIKIFDKMARLDMLNQFVTHNGGGFFACPPAAQPGEFIGQKLFA